MWQRGEVKGVLIIFKSSKLDGSFQSQCCVYKCTFGIIMYMLFILHMTSYTDCSRVHVLFLSILPALVLFDLVLF